MFSNHSSSLRFQNLLFTTQKPKEWLLLSFLYRVLYHHVICSTDSCNMKDEELKSMQIDNLEFVKLLKLLVMTCLLLFLFSPLPLSLVSVRICLWGFLGMSVLQLDPQLAHLICVNLSAGLFCHQSWQRGKLLTFACPYVNQASFTVLQILLVCQTVLCKILASQSLSSDNDPHLPDQPFQLNWAAALLMPPHHPCSISLT